MWNSVVRRARRLTSAMVSPPFPPRFVPPLFLSASHTTSFLASRSPSHESPSPFPAKTPVSHRRARPGIRGTIALMLLHWMPYTAWSALRDIGDSLIFPPWLFPSISVPNYQATTFRRHCHHHLHSLEWRPPNQRDSDVLHERSTPQKS